MFLYAYITVFELYVYVYLGSPYTHYDIANPDLLWPVVISYNTGWKWISYTEQPFVASLGGQGCGSFNRDGAGVDIAVLVTFLPKSWCYFCTSAVKAFSWI